MRTDFVLNGLRVRQLSAPMSNNARSGLQLAGSAGQKLSIKMMKRFPYTTSGNGRQRALTHPHNGKIFEWPRAHPILQELRLFHPPR